MSIAVMKTATISVRVGLRPKFVGLSLVDSKLHGLQEGLVVRDRGRTE